jgi:RNA polymerase sigma-70 factor (ECF subfamily)
MEDSIFEEIYRETARPLWSYISRISGSRTATDDILQETYLRFLRSPFKGGDLKEAKPYLYKIATNLVYKRFHRIKRQNETEESILSETSGEMAAAPDGFRERIEMTQVFSRLKEQERALLWLAHVEGYEHREIARILKLNSLSVRVLLYRARRKLEQLLKIEKN